VNTNFFIVPVLVVSDALSRFQRAYIAYCAQQRSQQWSCWELKQILCAKDAHRRENFHGLNLRIIPKKDETEGFVHTVRRSSGNVLS
jgi:hypothetical protein